MPEIADTSSSTPSVTADSFLATVVTGALAVSADSFQDYTANVQHAVSMEGFMRGYDPVAQDKFWDDSRYMVRYYRPYEVRDGVLSIPVKGALLNNYTYTMGNFATGHTYIRKAVERGMQDREVNAIAFDIDSPGGQVDGLPELANAIKSFKGAKPMKAFVNGKALSGAYWIASVADSIAVNPSGRTGSVGVFTVHDSIARNLDMKGVDVTIVQAGKHKAEGLRVRQLSDEAKQNIQNGINKAYGRFTAAVAENRGMDEKDVRDTEARVFDSEDSIDIGFADEMAEFESGFAQFTAEHGVRSMPQTNMNRPSDAGESGQVLTQADLDSAKAEAAAEARTSERKRFAEVQASDEYKGREALASKLLSTSDMASSEIIDVLSSAERKVAEPKAEEGNHFQKAMDDSDKPNVVSEEDEPNKNDFDTDSVFACFGQPSLDKFQGSTH